VEKEFGVRPVDLPARFEPLLLELACIPPPQPTIGTAAVVPALNSFRNELRLGLVIEDGTLADARRRLDEPR
jgi:hypothetical protein